MLCMEPPNVAVTVVPAFSVIAQVPVPVQVLPLQPAKEKVLPGVAVNVTCVPFAKFAEQVVGQLIPLGLLVTLPVPVPAKLTVKVDWGVGDGVGGVAPSPLQPLNVTRRTAASNTDEIRNDEILNSAFPHLIHFSL
jgi:hypothetical protein